MPDTDITSANPMDRDEIKKDAVKKKRDYSQDLKVEIPAATEMANNGLLNEAVERLLTLEKKSRLAGDIKSVVDVSLVVIKLCKQHSNWKELIANITLICKRRQQFKQVQSKVIQEAASYVQDTPNEAIKVELIDTLRKVSEGKIFVEVERARLTMTKALMEEAKGNVDEAAAVLQEEQVETYGGMDKREKLNYLLEQVRLVLKKKDYIRARIISNKVDKRIIDDVELEDLKIKYYNLLIEYNTHEKDALELARAHLAIYGCKCIQSDDKKWVEQLQFAVAYLALAPYDNHQIDLVHHVLQDKKLEKLPAYHSLLKHFTTGEIAPWPLPENDELTKNVLLRDDNMSDKENLDWYKVLKDRVMEHDIRVVAKYYTRIKTNRLANFLGLTSDETEDYVSSMVTSGNVRLEAKIDRPAGIVTFEAKKDANAHLSEWAEDISELLNLVEKTCHLIHKENMVHQIKN